MEALLFEAPFERSPLMRSPILRPGTSRLRDRPGPGSVSTKIHAVIISGRSDPAKIVTFTECDAHRRCRSSREESFTACHTDDSVEYRPTHSTGPSPPYWSKNSTLNPEHHRCADREARSNWRSIDSGTMKGFSRNGSGRADQTRHSANDHASPINAN